MEEKYLDICRLKRRRPLSIYNGSVLHTNSLISFNHSPYNSSCGAYALVCVRNALSKFVAGYLPVLDQSQCSNNPFFRFVCRFIVLPVLNHDSTVEI